MLAQTATAEPPPGLTLIADFISADEERVLVARVDAGGVEPGAAPAGAPLWISL